MNALFGVSMKSGEDHLAVRMLDVYMHSRLFAGEEKEAKAAFTKDCRCHAPILAPDVLPLHRKITALFRLPNFALLTSIPIIIISFHSPCTYNLISG